MSYLVDFLNARLDEDEAAANAALAAYESDAGDTWWTRPELVVELGLHMEDESEAIHMSRWSPERVLRDVEAKRKILELHLPMGFASPPGWATLTSKTWCQECSPASGTWPCGTLRTLAAVHSDHPDYDKAWS